MSTKPAPSTNFGGGLNLVDAPGLVPFESAVDCLNVTYTRRGAVRQRGGYATFATLGSNPDSIAGFTTSSGTRRLLVGSGTTLTALDGGGAVVATTAANSSPHFFVRFGGPVVEAAYIANGVDQIRRYDIASGFTLPVGLVNQTGKFVAVTPNSNRLMVAREPGTSAGNNPSSVNFSMEGDPETFNADHFQDLDPGDGQGIMGLCPYGNYVLVFKESKAWTYTGESPDAEGQPDFNFTKFSHGVGLAASRAVAAGDSAVYFLDRTGVYATDGFGEPTCISTAIEPFFTGDTPIYYKSLPLNHGSIDKAAMCWHDHRLYVAVPTGGSAVNNAMLVFDPRLGWWSIYDIPAAAMCSFRIGSGSQPELVFGRASGAATVSRHKTDPAAYTADALSTTGTGGTAIASRWRSGWTDLGNADQEKSVNDVDLWGKGACAVKVFVDFEFAEDSELTQSIAFTTEDSVWDEFVWNTGVWGSTATTTRQLLNRGFSATQFALELSNSTLNETWELNVVSPHIRSGRPSGLHRSRT